MHSYGELVERRGSTLRPLKSTSNAIFSYVGCLGLCAVISKLFSRKMCGSLKAQKYSLFTKNQKTLFSEFKVVQGHRCSYPRKARHQCLLLCPTSMCLFATVLLLDLVDIAEIAHFESVTVLTLKR